jgi:hypothetical protein
MRLGLVYAAIAPLLAAAPVAAQDPSDAEVARIFEEIRASHIEGNVPEEGDFERLLKRDLAAYFVDQGIADPSARFELLRSGPTQVGIAYPKYYLWVSIFSGNTYATSGAVRVQAVGKKEFQVTDFLAAEDARRDPERISSIFPAPLVAAISARAAATVPLP